MSLKIIFTLSLAVVLAVKGDETGFKEEIPNELSNIEEGKANLTGRIVGGYRANIADFSYQVSVQMKSRQLFRHFCGGSIITSTYVVSAAHCFYE